jgi:uncharacterized repeat protein (TIGR01451 family)
MDYRHPGGWDVDDIKTGWQDQFGTDDDTIENTASGLTSDYVDYNTSNNSASVSFKVKGAPDLQIQKTDYQTTISPGDEFTYTVFITNAGSEDATGIVITDVLPTYLSYITDTLQTLGITYTLPTAKTYRWDYPFDIEAGDVLTYQLGVLAASSMAGTTQVNSISVSTDTAEGTPPIILPPIQIRFLTHPASVFRNRFHPSNRR